MCSTALTSEGLSDTAYGCLIRISGVDLGYSRVSFVSIALEGKFEISLTISDCNSCKEG